MRYIGQTRRRSVILHGPPSVFQNLNHGFGITQFYHGAPYPGGEGYLGGTQDNGTILGLDDWGRDGWRLTSLVVTVAMWRSIPRIQTFSMSRARGLASKGRPTAATPFEFALNGITEERQNFLFITPFVMDPNNSSCLWTGGRACGAPTTVRRVGRRPVRSTSARPRLAPSPSPRAIPISWWSARPTAFVYRNDAALDAGSNTTWQWSRPRPGFVSSLAFDPSSPGCVYATYAGFGGPHVWRSSDGAVTWESIDGTGIDCHSGHSRALDRRRSGEPGTSLSRNRPRRHDQQQRWAHVGG